MNAVLLESKRKPERVEVLRKPITPKSRPAWVRKAAIAVLAVAALTAAAIGGWRWFSAPAAAAYNTVPVRRADIAKTITATGHVQAVTTVQVGSQVSGVISELHADFNNRVKKGQVIARLDPSQFQAQLTQARANLTSALAVVQSAQNGVAGADAAVASARHNVDRAESVVADARRVYERNVTLQKEGVLSIRDLEASQAAVTQAEAQKQQAAAQLDQAKAQALAARSQLEQAKAQSKQSQASVEVAEVNLDRTVIRAPIDGVVVARNVDVGQTVAASLQAPTLFLIANDLTRMQVLADIDEADVGQLVADTEVAFTVDAFPRDTFHGRVSQVRLASQTVQNVVTYTAVIDVANPDLKLKPGMTANITATVDKRVNALAVPNAAFRFRPPESVQAESPAPATQRPAGSKKGASSGGQRVGGTVWIETEGQLRPVRVRQGITDGVLTEIAGGQLKEGDPVAVPVQQAGQRAGAATRSPFGGVGGMRGGPR
jgi:HlyD family secretion protein